MSKEKDKFIAKDNIFNIEEIKDIKNILNEEDKDINENYFNDRFEKIEGGN